MQSPPSLLVSVPSPRKVIFANSSKKLQKNGIPSKIPMDTKIVVDQLVKPDNSYESEYSVVDNCWKTTVFPRKLPDSRDDVKYLETWLGIQLAKCSSSSKPTLPSRYGDKQVSLERSVLVALNQMIALDLGFSEIIRQVTLNCSERGELIHRMWHSSYNLFSTVYTDMAIQLRAHQFKLLDKVGFWIGAYYYHVHVIC